MIAASTYKGQTIGVFGLARSGVASVEALLAGGAVVCAWDDNEAARKALSIEPQDLYALDFKKLDALVLAPGVPLTHPKPHVLVEKAQAAHVPVIGDIELFAQSQAVLPTHKLVAITGTNGKSTTTALMAHVAVSAGLSSVAAGNIGTGVMGISPLPVGGVYVLELSSFQLDLTQSLAADVAVLLNITPDHLDRHGDLEGYVRAKSHLFEMQNKDGVAVIGVDDEHGRTLAMSLTQPVVPISVETAVTGGVYVKDGVMMDAINGAPEAVGRVDGFESLPGRHNGQNMAAVYASARILGLSAAQIFAGFASFPGLAHRLQPVGEINGVRFVNDSKATNTDAASKALASFPSIRWIAGGRFAEDGFGAINEHLGHVEKAYLIGEAAPRFAGYLEGRVPYEMAGTLEVALASAARDAAKGDVVLLAPACKAFDQFPNFEVRGNHFRDLVNQMMKEAQ